MIIIHFTAAQSKCKALLLGGCLRVKLQLYENIIASILYAEYPLQ